MTMAEHYVWRQWEPGRRPHDIRFDKVDWLVTKEMVEVAAFQPAHDCAACRAGNDQIEAFLPDNPERWIAMANLSIRTRTTPRNG